MTTNKLNVPLQKIIDVGAIQQEMKVYRISMDGNLNHSTFKPSKAYKKEFDDLEYVDVGKFSTSCYVKKRDAKSALKLFRKHHDGPRLIFGTILPKSGYSIISKCRFDCAKMAGAKKSHVDWWIFCDYDPSSEFDFVEEEGIR